MNINRHHLNDTQIIKQNKEEKTEAKHGTTIRRVRAELLVSLVPPTITNLPANMHPADHMSIEVE